MTIATEATPGPWAGNGATTEFAFNAPLFDEANIAVRVVTDATGAISLKTLDVDYTVEIEEDFSGATVTFTVAPASGTTVYITREAPILQERDFETPGRLPEEQVEQGLDEQALYSQELDQRLNGALQKERFIPTGETAQYDAGGLRIKNLADPEDDQDAATKAYADSATQGDPGDAGWSPEFNIVADGVRRVLQLEDWVGGEGTKPGNIGEYVGASGFTAVIGDAVDIRGPSGSGTGDVVTNGAVSAGNIAVFADGTGDAIEDSGAAPADFALDGHTHDQADITDLVADLAGKEPVDAEILRADTDDNVTAGYTATADDEGTKSSGTYTPAPAGGNLKRYVNGGAHTLAAPNAAGDYTMIIQITNNASAGAITLSGFTFEGGDAFTTTDGDEFFVYITKLNSLTEIFVRALQ